MSTPDDEFAEFDTPPEEILATLREGRAETVTWRQPSRLTITRSTLPPVGQNGTTATWDESR